MQPDKHSNIHDKYIQPRKTKYIGGWTNPEWTGSPHQGPGNRVAETPFNKRDAMYWRHDTGYGEHGYFDPKTDQSLITEIRNNPNSNTWDQLARGIFASGLTARQYYNNQDRAERLKIERESFPIETKTSYRPHHGTEFWRKHHSGWNKFNYTYRQQTRPYIPHTYKQLTQRAWHSRYAKRKRFRFVGK